MDGIADKKQNEAEYILFKEVADRNKFYSKRWWIVFTFVGLFLFLFLFSYPEQSSKSILLEQFDRQAYTSQPLAFAWLFGLLDFLTNGNRLVFEIILFALLSALWGSVAVRWGTLLSSSCSAPAVLVSLAIMNPMTMDFHVLATRHSFSLAFLFLAVTFSGSLLQWRSVLLFVIAIGFHYSTLPLVLLFALFSGYGEITYKKGMVILFSITIISFVGLAVFTNTRLAEHIPSSFYKKRFVAANPELVSEYPKTQKGQPWDEGYFNHECRVQWFYLISALGASWILLRFDKWRILGQSGIPMTLAALGSIILLNAYPGSNRLLYAALIPGMIQIPLALAQELEGRIKLPLIWVQISIAVALIMLVNLMIYT